MKLIVILNSLILFRQFLKRFLIFLMKNSILFKFNVIEKSMIQLIIRKMNIIFTFFICSFRFFKI